MNRFSNDPEWIGLLNAACQGQMSQQQWDELNARLIAGGESAQLEYLTFMEIHVELRRRAAEQMNWVTEYTAEEFTQLLLECLRHEQAARLAHEREGHFPPHPNPTAASIPPRLTHQAVPKSERAPEPKTRSRGTWQATGWSAALAAVLVISFAVWHFLIAPPVGVVVAANGAQVEQGRALTPGRLVRQGQHTHLSEGLAKLELNGGQATVVIEGPAKLRVHGPSHLELDYGRLTALNPSHAADLVIDTPTGQLVDIGTEFAVRVDSEGIGRFHVYEGQVRVQTTPADAYQATRDLIAGQATRRALDRMGFEAIRVNPRSYIRPGLYDEVVRFPALDAHRQWRLLHERLMDDPHLVAYTGFTPHAGSDSAVNGLERTRGRFPGTDAAVFDDAQDGLTLELPEQLEQGTFLAWVKLDQTHDPRLRSLVSSDASGAMQSDWQLTREARMRLTHGLAPQVDGGRTFIAASDTVLPASGGWTMVGLVFDAAAGTLDFYINGEHVHQRELATDEPLAFGQVTIGNAADGTRPLRGAIDELVVFDRVLSAEEIKGLAQPGT